tara:strand:- start:101 stop:739 length:639 start_codon:yes stop_codon:yes gene_type:complete
MAERLLEFDDWNNHCPICKDIVEHEDWPRLIDCGEIDSDEVKRGEKHPACIVCGSLELEETILTAVTKNHAGMSHTRLMRCRSCGVGRRQGEPDAVSGLPTVVFDHPPELEHREILKEIERHLEQGEENEELLQRAKFAIAVDAFFRPMQFYCLDTGWDVMGYGIRPLERTEIMTRFYEWTNREAMNEATAEDNPLAKKKNKVKKKDKWWNR